MNKTKKLSLIICTLLPVLYMISYLTRLNFTASMEEIIASGVITKEQGGIILAALFFAYGAGQIISGILSDKFSPGGVIGAGLITTVVCNILFPLMNGVIPMAIIWGINGLAQAMFWPPIVSIMATYLSDADYARCNVLVSSGAHIMTVLIYLLVPLSIGFFGWRAFFFISASLALITLIAWHIGYRRITLLGADTRREKPASAIEKQDRKGRFLPVILSSGIIFTLIAVLLQGFLKDGIQSWMPNFFTEVFNMPSSSAILSTAVLPIFNIVIVIVATHLYRKVFKNEITESLFFFALAALLSVALLFVYKSSAILSLLLAALITGSMHAINLMLLSFVPKYFAPEGKVATVTGLGNAFSYIGSTASSYGIAVISAKLGWSYTFISWGSVALTGVLFCVILLPIWNKFRKNRI